MATVADRIKLQREKKNMSQEELAKQCGWSNRSSISKIESSKNDVSMKKIVKIAEALGVSSAYLFGYEKETSVNLSFDELQIIGKWRDADDLTKDMVRRILGVI